MLELSQKYDISLIEIQVPKSKGTNKWISKTINFNYRLKTDDKRENKCKTFHSKNIFVSWLMCLE